MIVPQAFYGFYKHWPLYIFSLSLIFKKNKATVERSLSQKYSFDPFIYFQGIFVEITWCIYII